MSNAPPKRSLPAWAEKPYADFNWRPTDAALAQYPSEVGQNETGLDGPSARGLAAEIAHLQALIEGLTRR